MKKVFGWAVMVDGVCRLIEYTREDARVMKRTYKKLNRDVKIVKLVGTEVVR